MDSLKILIVEDVQEDKELLLFELERGGIKFVSQGVENEQHFIESLESFFPDVIISDFSLPQFNALEALKIRNEISKDVPFILVTGAQSEEVAVECIKNGADDYILKSNLTRLPTALHNAIKKKSAEREVREAVERSKFIKENMPEKVWTASPDGNINYFNARWYEYTGLGFHELKDSGWTSLIHKDDLEKNLKVWKKAIETGADFNLEHRFRRYDGQYRWHLCRGVAQRDPTGKIIMWIGTDTDIHDQMEIQEALRKTQEKLNLINLEISTKNEELIRLNADMDNFIYAAAHDLKAPLSNVEGLITVLKESVFEGQSIQEVEPLFGMISNSVTKFKDTISDLSEVAKVGKAEEVSINIFEVIEDVKETLKDVIEESKAIIKVSLKDCNEIAFSKKNFKSIVLNLINNSIKYSSPERKPEVIFTAEKVGDSLSIIVKDNGLGMMLTPSTNIFAKNKRLHSHVEGSGIGLYLVKKIIDNVQGRIEVESEVGKGSTFRIYLPV